MTDVLSFGACVKYYLVTLRLMQHGKLLVNAEIRAVLYKKIIAYFKI
jgi:hypothetical protein